MQVKQYEDLLDKTFVSVKNVEDEELIFEAETGERYKFFHYQDCCESVTIEDIVGDLNDLVGSPLLMAEETTYFDEYPGDVEVSGYQESFTWTFYKFATVKGYVTIRWYGESNGYYSERVYFTQIAD